MSRSDTYRRWERRANEKNGKLGGPGVCGKGIVGNLAVLLTEEHIEPNIVELLQWALQQCDATPEEQDLIRQILAKHNASPG